MSERLVVQGVEGRDGVIGLYVNGEAYATPQTYLGKNALTINRAIHEKLNSALNAAPQAEKAREIIERAEEELRSWSDHFHCRDAMLSTESTDQLLADIAAYKEG